MGLTLDDIVKSIHDNHPEYATSVFNKNGSEVVFFTVDGLPIATLELDLGSGTANLFEYKNLLKKVNHEKHLQN